MKNNNRGINRGPESQIEGKFHFHYSREEREQGLSEKTREVLAKRKGSWWRRNPGQAFTLLDIVIIALVVVVLFPLVNFFSSRPSLGGYTWDGSYFILGDGPDIIILTGEGSREGEVPLDLKILSDAGEELYQGSYPLAGTNRTFLSRRNCQELAQLPWSLRWKGRKDGCILKARTGLLWVIKKKNTLGAED
jgi:hypothetical protein